MNYLQGVELSLFPKTVESLQEMHKRLETDSEPDIREAAESSAIFLTKSLVPHDTKLKITEPLD